MFKNFEVAHKTQLSMEAKRNVLYVTSPHFLNGALFEFKHPTALCDFFISLYCVGEKS